MRDNRRAGQMVETPSMRRKVKSQTGQFGANSPFLCGIMKFWKPEITQLVCNYDQPTWNEIAFVAPERENFDSGISAIRLQ